jgi:pyruvate dehydrogenase E2 component (dihydrolipoamide acetyltransferase)
LGIGRISKKLVVVEDTGAFMVRRMTNLSLTFDHRLIDGAPAARFLALLSKLIENPPKDV